MNEITHEQAIEYIHLGLLHRDDFQKAALSAHLSRCTECQDYASLQDRLSPLLSQVMHDRWDRHRLPTSETGEISSKFQRKAKARNVLAFANVVVLLAALIFGSYAIYNRIPLPVLQPGSNLQSIETMTAALPVQLDPAVCDQQAFPAPAGVNLPYPATKVIGGDMVKEGHFTFQIYLYCDETLRPDDPQHFSEIAGLGIMGKWSYDGPSQKGLFLWMHGIEPSLKTSLPSLNKGDYGGMSGGLSFPDRSSSEWQVTDLAKSGKLIQYSIKIGTENHLYGATLSFKLQEGTSGYIPVDIEVKLDGLKVPPPTSSSQTSPIMLLEELNRKASLGFTPGWLHVREEKIFDTDEPSNETLVSDQFTPKHQVNDLWVHLGKSGMVLETVYIMRNQDGAIAQVGVCSDKTCWNTTTKEITQWRPFQLTGLDGNFLKDLQRLDESGTRTEVSKINLSNSSNGLQFSLVDIMGEPVDSTSFTKPFIQVETRGAFDESSGYLVSREEIYTFEDGAQRTYLRFTQTIQYEEPTAEVLAYLSEKSQIIKP